MRSLFILFFIAIFAFGYEISHENIGKFYKFSGEADGIATELYINVYKNEFENLKSTKDFEVPSKTSGHIFFSNNKFEFDKGMIEQKNDTITKINAKSEWIDLNVENNTNNELVGKVAIKGKAYKLTLKQDISFEIITLAKQLSNDNGLKFQAILSDFSSTKFINKYRKNLTEDLKNLQVLWQNRPQKDENHSKITRLFYQNERIKNICTYENKITITCKTSNIKNSKNLSLSSLFKNLKDENLQKIFTKHDIRMSENFTLSPMGLTFYSDDEKTLSLDEIKPFLKDSFGL
ncbi:hypothetical protein KDE13_06925 [Campylobacter sp. faydin G-140]|uniref:hypothetical protein n=1 Tax=Campylobacter anatolicus TaxID=2829105 RepID=UPI001B954F54|nr:hypothetical protein [Campylobacter anatolicus]MBR8461548.1 hypothetical protein [Campylobacter anatolicus]MBR8466074.1 hypothetical protein [Campylobacter anatolicus]